MSRIVMGADVVGNILFSQYGREQLHFNSVFNHGNFEKYIHVTVFSHFLKFEFFE